MVVNGSCGKCAEPVPELGIPGEPTKNILEQNIMEGKRLFFTEYGYLIHCPEGPSCENFVEGSSVLRKGDL